MQKLTKPFKTYAVVTDDNYLAACLKSGKPLIHDNRQKLADLLDLMSEQDSAYLLCRVVCLGEVEDA